MAYKSPCKACDHPHDGMICQQCIVSNGTIKLRPWTSTIWGVSGGMAKEYSPYGSQGQEQITFRPFDIGREESFEYAQDRSCGCRFYVPSDNLEFLEWKYEATGK